MTPAVASDEMRRLRFLRQDEVLCVHQMLREFSTWEPFGQALRRQLNLIGTLLRTWFEAAEAFHFFTDPPLSRLDYMKVGQDDRDIAADFTLREMNASLPKEIAEITKGPLWDLCREIAPGRIYLAIPLSSSPNVFGAFVLCFQERLPDRRMYEGLRATLNVLHGCLRDLLYNHYPITNFTYLPSFQRPQSTESAVLFCDIRNSTRMIEVTRMASQRYTEMLVALFKGFLEYGSCLLTVTDVGRIHNFMGDGFMATFGEYLALEREHKARVACSLALLAGQRLIIGFQELWDITRKHDLCREFIENYNEDLDLRLGIGINFGLVRFDIFGISTGPASGTRGFYEFTAVGDHVNFAQRLCGVASQPVSTSDIVYRSPKLAGRLTAPIVISRTVAHWTSKFFQETVAIEDCRTDFGHKGKGFPLPSFEVALDHPNLHHLLRNLEKVHDNRFRDALRPEIEEGAILKPVCQRHKDRLDQIHAKGH